MLILIDAAYSKAVRDGALSHWSAAEGVRTADTNVDEAAVGDALDLHGYSVPLARAAMRHVLISELLDHEIDRAGPDSDLLVITGRGKGSGEEGAVLGPAVLRMLSEEAEPPIAAYSVPGNEGRVRIDRESLRQWLAANAEHRE